MGLGDWLNAYWKPTAASAGAPVVTCPVCRSGQAALTIPESPEFEAHVCRRCAYEWSIPVGTSSQGLPLWGDSIESRRQEGPVEEGERG